MDLVFRVLQKAEEVQVLVAQAKAKAKDCIYNGGAGRCNDIHVRLHSLKLTRRHYFVARALFFDGGGCISVNLRISLRFS